MCRRAVQRLEEYEVRIMDLAGRRSNALYHNDSEQVETYPSRVTGTGREDSTGHGRLQRHRV